MTTRIMRWPCFLIIGIILRVINNNELDQVAIDKLRGKPENLVAEL
jgi:hypothetical protein